MNIQVRGYTENDMEAMIRIWNEVVEDGIAFPQEETLTLADGREFFAAQTYSAVAENTESGEILGPYILHPNNVGRCGHICNASYAVSSRGAACTSAKSSSRTAWSRGGGTAFAYCSSTPSSSRTSTRGICTSGLALYGSERYRAALE